MDKLGPKYRSDEQLAAILNEGSRWIANGPRGQMLWSTTSLREAIERATAGSLTGSIPTAVCRLVPDEIVIFTEQIGRLQNLLSVGSTRRPDDVTFFRSPEPEQIEHEKGEKVHPGVRLVVAISVAAATGAWVFTLIEGAWRLAAFVRATT
jgi:hypothetical protein